MRRAESEPLGPIWLWPRQVGDAVLIPSSYLLSTVIAPYLYPHCCDLLLVPQSHVPFFLGGCVGRVARALLLLLPSHRRSTQACQPQRRCERRSRGRADLSQRGGQVVSRDCSHSIEGYC